MCRQCGYQSEQNLGLVSCGCLYRSLLTSAVNYDNQSINGQRFSWTHILNGNVLAAYHKKTPRPSLFMVYVSGWPLPYPASCRPPAAGRLSSCSLPSALSSAWPAHSLSSRWRIVFPHHIELTFPPPASKRKDATDTESCMFVVILFVPLLSGRFLGFFHEKKVELSCNLVWALPLSGHRRLWYHIAAMCQVVNHQDLQVGNWTTTSSKSKCMFHLWGNAIKDDLSF